MGISRVLAVLAAVLAVAFAFLQILERTGELRLPAPCFKPVGLNKKFSVAAVGEGLFAPNNVLHKAQRIYDGVAGSENVAVSKDGLLYMIDRFGFVLKASGDGKDEAVKIAHLGPGRPLGFHFNKAGDLIICNAGVGLQSLEKKSGKVVLLTSLAPKSPGSSEITPIQLADDLSFDEDGGIFFTDAADIPPAYNAHGYYDSMAAFMLSLARGEPTGRLLHLSPEGKTTCVADDLFFPNGVEVVPDQKSVLVVETSLNRIVRVWIDGPKAGSKEIFIDNLPGYPDGLSKGVDGSYWISLVCLKQPGLEAMTTSRLKRWLIHKLPASMAKLAPGAAVIQVSPEGKIMRYMADMTGDVVASLTAVTETSKGLYIGNLAGDYVSFLTNSDYSQLIKEQ